MTNSVFLLLAALMVFAFGYRFFAKFLALWVFRLGSNYTTPSPDSGRHLVPDRHRLFGQRTASLGAATAIAGTLLALIWGWIPAFLWVVVGTAIGAGTYGVGSLWLATRSQDDVPVQPARTLVGKRARAPIVALLVALSLLINWVMALIVADVLIAFPASAIPFWLLAALTLAPGLFSQLDNPSRFLPATGVVLIVMLLTLWLLRAIPLHFVGFVQLQTSAGSALTLDAQVLWVVAAFAFAWYVARRPIETHALSYSLTSAAFLSITLFTVFAAVIIEHPVLAVPAFHTPKDAPSALPLLFITLTSGAVSGWHFLAAGSFGGNRLARDIDARYIGYGGALVEGLIALSAILIGGTAAGGQAARLHVFDTWDGAQHLALLLRIYIDGFASLANAIGVNMAFAQSVAALTIMSLAMTTIIGGIRVQFRILDQLSANLRVKWLNPPRMLAVTVASTALLAAQASRIGAMWYWPLFGLTNQLVAATVLGLITLLLLRLRQPLMIVLIPLLFLAIVVSWALILQLGTWWSGGNWALFATGLVLAGLAAWALVEVILALRQPVTSGTD